MVLSEASDLSGLARGLAYQLTENLGVLRRETASAEIKALDQAARAQLRKYGARFGAFNVYIPALLKPAAADLVLMLWALHSGREHGIDEDALPARPQQGLTSVEAGNVPEPYWRAAGFHVAGTRAVRIDMLERLSDLIRARIAYRSAEGGVAPPTGATGDGGFRVVPELMSVVGCSGEEFCSILKALGFRRERRKLAPVPGAEALAPTPSEAEAGQEVATADAPAEVFDEIWRPGKRREAREARQETRREHKPRREERGKAPRRERQRPQAHAKREAEASRERERKRAVEHSPFAALEALRSRLTDPPAGRKLGVSDAGSAARQMALVREAGQDAHRRRTADRSRQGPRQWRPRAEIEPAGAGGRRGDGGVSRQAGGGAGAGRRRAAGTGEPCAHALRGSDSARAASAGQRRTPGSAPDQAGPPPARRAAQLRSREIRLRPLRRRSAARRLQAGSVRPATARWPFAPSPAG